MSEPFMFLVFGVIVVAMLILDLGFFNKNAHKVTSREAITWSLFWIGLSMAFSAFIYLGLGLDKWSEFQTAYWIEKSLSVDNLFVFIMVFKFFNVDERYHHKVLFWGIIGAIFLRAIFIFSGVGLINITYLPTFTLLGMVFENVNVILTLFGGFLVYAGIKTLLSDDDEENDFSDSFGIKIVKLFFPVTDKYDGGKFFTIENGKKVGTMLLVVIGVIEVTDLLFAVDSIPAIFTVSRDPLILYTSNIFAILGLRTLYFVLSNFMSYFAYLKYGISFILAFIGVKMLIAPFVHISSPISLSVVAFVLVFSALASVIWKPKENM